MKVTLNTESEKKAIEACHLPEFSKLSLKPLKEGVAEILSMIGQIDGLFSTYTKHDISHIESMLDYLEWMIPPSTKKIMTPVDWLLTTLSIYFHDLGMVVSYGEFENRMENPQFKHFLDDILNLPDFEDYRSRAEKMDDDDKEKFYFQEFIRKNHPKRIRQWITGRVPKDIDKSIPPIIETFNKYLEDLPPRFRDDLGKVCESHHLDNLDQFDEYPLCRKYGSKKLENANVQFSALLLRTADLIHVSHDRTPSTMYQAIKFTDPMSISEWDKQLGVFSVSHPGRHFNEENVDKHKIIIGGDFTKEEPFFSLSQYVTWADNQIKQNNRWGELAQKEEDGEDFWFPWHSIEGNLCVNGQTPENMRFEFDRSRLLELLVGHAIYNDPTVAIRELLQNAIDAVRYQYYTDKKKHPSSAIQGRINIAWDSEERNLIIEDNGTGMDLHVINNHLMKVGSSFYSTAKFNSTYNDFNPISKFGIGVLTCFMISDDVEIITFKDNRGYRIRMTDVQSNYLLREVLVDEHPGDFINPHGTRVILKLRGSVAIPDEGIEEIIQNWILLPECQISFKRNGEEKKKIGHVSAEEHLKTNLAKNTKTTDKKRTIVTKTKEINGTIYELAVSLVDWSLGFKSFETSGVRNARSLTAVCLEGIKVSNRIPGFERIEFPALLSVRGTKSIRTTVSRSDLEIDDGYDSLGKICVDLFCELIEDEIGAVETKPGKPYSLASTIANRLIADISLHGMRDKVKTYLDKKTRSINRVVIEKRNSSSSFRSLVSLSNLAELKNLWIIESRLLDYLGTISRDIGRELSLNEFLTKLAPDVSLSDYQPFLPDSVQYNQYLINNFSPSSFVFSKKNKFSAMNLTPQKIRVREMPAELQPALKET